MVEIAQHFDIIEGQTINAQDKNRCFTQFKLFTKIITNYFMDAFLKNYLQNFINEKIVIGLNNGSQREIN